MEERSFTSVLRHKVETYRFETTTPRQEEVRPAERGDTQI